MRNNSEAPQADGCLPSVIGVALLTSAFFELYLLKSDRLMNHLIYEPERRTQYEKQELDQEDTTQLQKMIQGYSVYLTERSNSQRVILSEQVLEQNTPALQKLEKEIAALLIQERLGYKRFNTALKIIADAEMVALKDGSSQRISPFLFQLKGMIHETIAQLMKSPNSQKYWFAKAIQDYILAHRYDHFSTVTTLQNPIKVMRLLQQMGELSLVKVMQGEETTN